MIDVTNLPPIGEKRTYTLRGQNETFDIYNIPLDVLKYNEKMVVLLVISRNILMNKTLFQVKMRNLMHLLRILLLKVLVMLLRKQKTT